jgi:predicted transposase YdaD
MLEEPMGNKDISGKYLIDRDPVGWVHWLFEDPTLEVIQILSPEFQFVARHTDFLVKVRDHNGEFCILIELQLQYDATIPLRTLIYSGLAQQKFSLPVAPIVVYLTPPPAGVDLPDHYHAEFMGFTTHQNFRVVKLWEIEATEVLALQAPASILPYIPLMAGATEAIIQTTLTRIRAEENHEELETILAMFAMIKFSAQKVEELMRWDMSILEKSPLYQEILTKGVQQGQAWGRKEGLEQGLEQGMEQGLELGLEQGLERSILRILTRRFGQYEADLPDRLAELPPLVLEQLLDEAITAETYPLFTTYLAILEKPTTPE